MVGDIVAFYGDKDGDYIAIRYSSGFHTVYERSNKAVIYHEEDLDKPIAILFAPPDDAVEKEWVPGELLPTLELSRIHACNKGE